MKILVTGANGLMGTHLLPLLKDAVGVDRKETDLTKQSQVVKMIYKHKPELVIHLAAYTDVAGAEKKKRECYDINVLATRYLAQISPAMIYMSTDYVFDGEVGNYNEDDYPNPINFYSLTKLIGEYEALRNKNNKVIRTSFKPRPFEHSLVPDDMFFSGDYVDIMAKEIALFINTFDRLPYSQIYHMGTGKKRLIDFAAQTKEVIAAHRGGLPVKLPRDVSLDTSFWEEIKDATRT